MDSQAVIEKLKVLKKKRGEIGKIEWEVGMPKNSLSRYVSGHAVLPTKWVQPLADCIVSRGNSITVALPKDFIGVTKIGIINPDGTIVELKSADQLPKELALSFMGLKQLSEDERTVLEAANKRVFSAVKTRLDDYNQKHTEARITELKKELASPPPNPMIGLRKWKQLRETELANLLKQLQ